MEKSPYLATWRSPCRLRL